MVERIKIEGSEDAEDNQLQKLSTELDGVVVDLKLQIQCDPQLASGVLKFADRYFKMRRNKTHTPACLCIPSLWVELW